MPELITVRFIRIAKRGAAIFLCLTLMGQELFASVNRAPTLTTPSRFREISDVFTQQAIIPEVVEVVRPLDDPEPTIDAMRAAAAEEEGHGTGNGVQRKDEAFDSSSVAHQIAGLAGEMENGKSETARAALSAMAQSLRSRLMARGYSADHLEAYSDGFVRLHAPVTEVLHQLALAIFYWELASVDAQNGRPADVFTAHSLDLLLIKHSHVRESALPQNAGLQVFQMEVLRRRRVDPAAELKTFESLLDSAISETLPRNTILSLIAERLPFFRDAFNGYSLDVKGPLALVAIYLTISSLIPDFPSHTAWSLFENALAERNERLHRVDAQSREQNFDYTLMNVEDITSYALSFSMNPYSLFLLMLSLDSVPQPFRDRIAAYHLAVQSLHPVSDEDGNGQETIDVLIVAKWVDYCLTRIESGERDNERVEEMATAVTMAMVYYSRFSLVQAVLARHPKSDVAKWFRRALKYDQHVPFPILGANQFMGTHMAGGYLEVPMSRLLLHPWDETTQRILQTLSERGQGFPVILSHDQKGSMRAFKISSQDEELFTSDDVLKWIQDASRLNSAESLESTQSSKRQPNGPQGGIHGDTSLIRWAAVVYEAAEGIGKAIGNFTWNRQESPMGARDRDSAA